MSQKKRNRVSDQKAAEHRGGWLARPLGRFVFYYLMGLLAAGVVVCVPYAWKSTGPARPEDRELKLPNAKPGAQAADLFSCYQAGVDYLSAERYAAALKELTQAARLAPEDPRPPFQIGQVYRHLQLLELEEQAYRKALQLDPEHHQARVNLARVLCDSGNNEEALALLQEARKQKPDDPIVWGELALNYQRLGQPGEAVPLLEKYNAALGEQDWGYANLGRAYAATGDNEKAEEAYRRAIAFNSHSELVHLWLGQLLVTKGQRAEADAVLKRFRYLRELQTQEIQIQSALVRDADNVGHLLKLAQIRNLLRKPREALVPLKRILELQPKNVDALVSVAHALSLMDQPKAALGPLREAIEIQPDNQNLRELYEVRRQAAERAPRDLRPNRPQ